MNKQNQNFCVFEEIGLKEAISLKVKAELEKSNINSKKTSSIILGLENLFKLEKKVLAKLASKTEDFLKIYTNSEIGQKIFHMHEELVTDVYGPQVNFMESAIDEATVRDLSDHLEKINEVRYSDFIDCNQPYIDNDPLYKRIFSKEKIVGLDNNLTLLDYKNDELNQSLLSIIRKKISKHVKSPFAFINTRAWTTKPNAESFGPNEEHLDGFNAGHMKIMIYLTPMNDEYGYFTIAGDKIIDRKPGTIVLFRNSDIIHSGIAGTRFPRISMEITLQRTLLNSSQANDGHPVGRHNYCITSAYNGGTLKF